jgi:hypothetical protein
VAAELELKVETDDCGIDDEDADDGDGCRINPRCC